MFCRHTLIAWWSISLLKSKAQGEKISLPCICTESKQKAYLHIQGLQNPRCIKLCILTVAMVLCLMSVKAACNDDFANHASINSCFTHHTCQEHQSPLRVQDKSIEYFYFLRVPQFLCWKIMRQANWAGVRTEFACKERKRKIEIGANIGIALHLCRQ